MLKYIQGIYFHSKTAVCWFCEVGVPGTFNSLNRFSKSSMSVSAVGVSVAALDFSAAQSSASSSSISVSLSPAIGWDSVVWMSSWISNTWKKDSYNSTLINVCDDSYGYHQNVNIFEDIYK